MVPFDQIFYWNSGVNFADPNDVILGSFQGNSMGSLSSSDPEAATYTDLGFAGYGMTAATYSEQLSAQKWNAIQYKFNGFHKEDPLTAKLQNKAFKGIKIRLKFKRHSLVSLNNWGHLDNEIMHITIKQNGTVLKPAAGGSPESSYTWGFVKATPDAGSDYMTVPFSFTQNGHINPGDILLDSDVPNNSDNWNKIPRPFDFPTSPQGATRSDSMYESISNNSLAPHVSYTEGLLALPSDSVFSGQTNVVAQLMKTKYGYVGRGPWPMKTNDHNYADRIYVGARYYLSDATDATGYMVIWDSDDVIPPQSEFEVTFARNSESPGSITHNGTVYRNINIPYDCRLELIAK